MLKVTRTGTLPALIAALALVVVPLASGCGGSSSKKAAAESPPAVSASVSELKNLEGSLRHPIYWAGAKTGFTYELTQTRSGNIYVRYLPSGVKVGDGHPNYLTVGTYPQGNAYKRVVTASRRKGAIKSRLSGGGLAVQNASRPTSVYVAYPNLSLLIEVFDPSGKIAGSLVRSGQIRPLS